MNATALDFDAAAQQEHTLSARQWEILALIAEGRTNPEIAAQFNITLDGAKWNVSEILTKLGLASREELAAYHRWRRQPARRVSRWARGLIAAPLAKWIGGGAAVAVVAAAGVAVVLVAGRSSPAEAGLVAPFTLEAVVRVTSRINPVTVGTNIEGGPTNGSDDPPKESVSSLRWWYQSAEQFRSEVQTQEPVADRGLVSLTADGSALYVYDEATNSYSQQNLPPNPTGRLFYPTSSLVLGPLAERSRAELAVLFGAGRNPSFTMEPEGTTTLLGRLVTILRWGPVGTKSADGGEEPDGFGRIWVDEADWVILRQEFETEGSSVVAEVTRYEAGVKHPRDFFEFTVPVGAKLVPDGGAEGGPSQSGSASQAPRGAAVAYSVPAPFVAPAGLPAGFEATGTSEESSAGPEPSAFSVTFHKTAAGESGWIEIRQVRRVALPEGVASDERRTVAGVETYLARSPAQIDLFWQRDGVMTVVTARDVPEADLYAIAEAMLAAP